MGANVSFTSPPVPPFFGRESKGAPKAALKPTKVGQSILSEHRDGASEAGAGRFSANVIKLLDRPTTPPTEVLTPSLPLAKFIEEESIHKVIEKLRNLTSTFNLVLKALRSIDQEFKLGLHSKEHLAHLKLLGENECERLRDMLGILKSALPKRDTALRVKGHKQHHEISLIKAAWKSIDERMSQSQYILNGSTGAFGLAIAKYWGSPIIAAQASRSVPPLSLAPAKSSPASPTLAPTTAPATPIAEITTSEVLPKPESISEVIDRLDDFLAKLVVLKEEVIVWDRVIVSDSYLANYIYFEQFEQLTALKESFSNKKNGIEVQKDTELARLRHVSNAECQVTLIKTKFDAINLRMTEIETLLATRKTTYSVTSKLPPESITTDASKNVFDLLRRIVIFKEKALTDASLYKDKSPHKIFADYEFYNVLKSQFEILTKQRESSLQDLNEKVRLTEALISIFKDRQKDLEDSFTEINAIIEERKRSWTAILSPAAPAGVGSPTGAPAPAAPANVAA